ncbi:hypothetical protein [Neptunicella marina]|uniref:Uncharacterized protein n=1 Tax=Neptunicella marina TaxID=2125989 RepID=A0A8J6ISK0_9ALTE|nr:hypothetical protein [Neptunicella marina]MBC3765077.1 hypothetical protein [Neptunicella marina]
MTKHFCIFLIFSASLFSQANADEASHLRSCESVYNISMGSFSMEQAKQFAQAISPELADQQEKIATAIFEVMTSEEYKHEYSKSIASIFSEEECIRLADILADPVLEKFRANKGAYFQNMLKLAQKMIDDRLK